MEKFQLRQRMVNILNQLSADELQHKSRGACVKLCSTNEFRQAQVVMLFLPLASEIDTAYALQAAFSEEKTVLLPKVIWEANRIVPVRLTALDAKCEPDRYGLRNPIQAEQVPTEEIDLVAVPGLAFDIQANRLGRGGGFYDRFFADPDLRAWRCGFAFHEQLLTKIPVGPEDQPIDMLVTNQQIVRFEKKL